LEFCDQTITGKTAVYGVIGDPVDHSMSPLMQNAAFRKLGIDAIYVPFSLRSRMLEAGIIGLKSLGVRGFNVTIPHKMHVVEHLDELDHKASEIGSVNTVVNIAGRLVGHNTDGVGALNTLNQAGISVSGRKVLLFGAGGAAHAIGHAIAPMAAEITIVNRNPARGKRLMARLAKIAKGKVSFVALKHTRLERIVRQADLIVNASSMGMANKLDVPIEAGWLQSKHTVFDIVYEPTETRLLKIARGAGARTVNGLDMLLNQGACSFEIWTGKPAPISSMREAVDRFVEG